MLNRKNMGNAVIYGIVAGAVVTSIYLASEAVSYARKFNVLSEVDAAVDFNGDYRASKEEWGVVYSTLGVQDTGRRGEDLEPNQLEKYLKLARGE